MRERREGRDAHDSLSSLCPPPRARGARTTHRRPATRRVVVRPARAGRDREVDMANAIFGLSVFAVGEERVIKKERVPASRAPPGAQTRENSLPLHAPLSTPAPPAGRPVDRRAGRGRRRQAQVPAQSSPPARPPPRGSSSSRRPRRARIPATPHRARPRHRRLRAGGAQGPARLPVRGGRGRGGARRGRAGGGRVRGRAGEC